MDARILQRYQSRFALYLIALLVFFSMVGCDAEGNIAIPEVGEGSPAAEYDLYEKMHVNYDNYKTKGISRDELLAFFPDLPLPEEFMGVPFFCANVSAPYEYHDGTVALPAERRFISGIMLYYMRGDQEGGVHQIMIVSDEYNILGDKVTRVDLSDAPERYVYVREETGMVSDLVEVRGDFSIVFFGSIRTVEDAEAYIANEEVQALINGVDEWLQNYNPKPANVSEEMWQQTLKRKEAENEPKLGLNQMLRKNDRLYGGSTSVSSREELLSYFPDLPIPEEFRGNPLMIANINMNPPSDSFPYNEIIDIPLVPENVAMLYIYYVNPENYGESDGIQIMSRKMVFSKEKYELVWLSTSPERYVYIQKETGEFWLAIEGRGDRLYGFNSKSVATASDAEQYIESEEVQDLIAALDEWFHKP